MEGGSHGSAQSSSSGNGNSAIPARVDWFTGVDTIVRTEVKYSEYKFSWEVPKFRTVINQGSRIYSPAFVDPKTHHTWGLFVDPKRRFEGIDYVGVGLQLREYGSHDDSAPVNFHFAIRVLDKNLGSIQNGVTEGMMSLKRGEGVGQQKLLVTDEILKGRLLPDDNLCLHIMIQTEVGITHTVLKNDRGLTPPLPQVESAAAVKRPNV